jgi:uncharacterized protein YdhG (YjbR/CyaY superfamily)
MQSKAATVDEYLTELPDERREAMTVLRRLIHESVPGLQEEMAYGMPTFKKGEILVGLASQKQYISIYLDVDLVEKHRAGLGKADCGKSCVRARKLADLPLDTVRIILQETDARQSASKRQPVG